MSAFSPGLAGALDRTLPVPLGTQLRGLIEFGIALGELPTGQRLPSVRELAERAGIAHMTVATVYRELREAGLIEAKPGAGTYVGDGHNSDGLRSSAIRKIQRRIETLFNEAEQLGLAPSVVSSLVNARAARGPDADTAAAPRDGGQLRRNDAAICQPHSGTSRLRRYHRRHDGRCPARGRDRSPCPATSA